VTGGWAIGLSEEITSCNSKPPSEFLLKDKGEVREGADIELCSNKQMYKVGGWGDEPLHKDPLYVDTYKAH